MPKRMFILKTLKDACILLADTATTAKEHTMRNLININNRVATITALVAAQRNTDPSWPSAMISKVRERVTANVIVNIKKLIA